MKKKIPKKLQTTFRTMDAHITEKLDQPLLASTLLYNKAQQIAAENYTQEDYLKDFKSITDEMYEVTKRKNSDYTGDVSDPFKNFKQVELMGICSAEQGFLTRMTDKMMRISSFVKNGELQVKDESVTDTLQDLAVYSILMLCYVRSKRQDSGKLKDGEVV